MVYTVQEEVLMFKWKVRDSIWYSAVATLIAFYFGFMFMVPPLDTLPIEHFFVIVLAMGSLIIATAGKGKFYG